MAVLAVHELVGGEAVFAQQVIRLDEAFLLEPRRERQGLGSLTGRGPPRFPHGSGRVGRRQERDSLDHDSVDRSCHALCRGVLVERLLAG